MQKVDLSDYLTDIINQTAETDRAESPLISDGIKTPKSILGIELSQQQLQDLVIIVVNQIATYPLSTFLLFPFLQS